MPNIPTRVGRYCVFHGIIHKDEYLECDFCNEHKDWICSKDRYYKYGFSKRSYLACMECHHLLFGPFRIVDCDNMMRAYEDILKVINDRIVVKVKGGKEIIDYYEAVRIALIESEYMRRHFDPVIKNTTQINKMFKPIWEFTYKIVSGEEWKRVKVVNRDPDNLLVQWVPGGKTITEILKEMNKGCRSILYT
jgi:hypothetical protein